LTGSLDGLAKRLSHDERFADPLGQLVVNLFRLVARVDEDEHRPVILVTDGATCRQRNCNEHITERKSSIDTSLFILLTDALVHRIHTNVLV
jgi:hypothetical protein